MDNKYLKYLPQELALDDQFIQWVQSGKPSASPWTAWLQNNPQMASRVDEAAIIVYAFQFADQPITEGKTDALWAKINNTIALENGVKSGSPPRRKIFRLVAYAAAACIALFLISRIAVSSDESISVGSGETLAHVLPDSSEVRLNADSKITYNKTKWSKDRSISLQGEGYFEVEKGQKFTVHTAYGDITVLGTSFNIYSRVDGFNVHCTSGRVQVTSGSHKVILTPYTRTILSNGTLVKEDNLQNKNIDWLDKIYRFDAIPLKYVFEAVERQFDVDVTYDQNIGNRLYTGSFEATDLDKVLNTICFPMELNSKIQGSVIRIHPDEKN